MRNYINTFLKTTVVGAACFFMTSCDTAFEDIKYSNGEANLSRYVAIGGGYTAGYCDSALYLEAQRYSFPAILASRFALAEGGEFKQPLVNAGVGIGVNGNARYRFSMVQDICGTGTILKATPAAATGDISNFQWIGGSPVFNNMGVPGSRMRDLTLQSFGDPSPFIGNPFYARFASSPGISTVTGDAVAQGPTFFTIWMGLEDIYGYARKGGNESGDSITSVSSFEAELAGLINSLQAVGSRGVMANLPGPDAIPFFTSSNTKGLTLTQQEADTLNILYAPINPAIQFTAGANYYVISDNAAPGGRRQLTSGEYLLLTVPFDSIRCYDMGTLIPIPARHVLDVQEVANVSSAVNSYNTVISNLGAAENIAVVDMHTFFNSLTVGTPFGGTSYSASYPYGGFYSTDGFYPTPRGYALITNRFLETINAAFKARLPFADVNAYPGVRFP
jgi:hypothetical protein